MHLFILGSFRLWSSSVGHIVPRRGLTPTIRVILKVTHGTPVHVALIGNGSKRLDGSAVQ